MKKILIVDDSEMTRNFHAYILKNSDFLVLDAEDGAEALEKLYKEKDQIGLILTDINMPNMNGYTLIEKIRADNEMDDITIGIITTLDQQKDKEKGYEKGVDFYLVKPVDPGELIESIKMILG